MDHAVKATRGRPWNKLRFENDELECLYQRYTLKLQRFSVTGVVALVVVLCGVMAALSLSYTRAPTLHVSVSLSQIETETDIRNNKSNPIRSMEINHDHPSPSP